MDASVYLSYDRLIAGARDPGADLTQAFAGVLSRFHTLGLPEIELVSLLRQFFPGDSALLGALPHHAGIRYRFREEEHQDLAELLLEHRTHADEKGAWLAHAVATACLGENHLWQDMGLANREQLSMLMATHFTPLYVHNGANMKWKRFFYKQLCERSEINLCKAPSCGACVDYSLCFGPEDGPAMTRREGVAI